VGELMSTKEVAAYLGIHEKKVYTLAKRHTIPCTRVTGKWLFPKRLIDQWIEESARGTIPSPTGVERPYILVAGSDDPSLGTLRECYTRHPGASALFLSTVGSQGGLAALRDGIADVALTHLVDPVSGDYNLPYIRQIVPTNVVTVTLFHRELGLVMPAGNPLGLRSLADLARPDVRMINRQERSGTRWYLDHELSRAGIAPACLKGYEDAVSTHLEVGVKILRQEVDAGLATRATARLLGLDFMPLTQERFDMVIPMQRFAWYGVQTLVEVVGSGEFRRRLEGLSGYNTSVSGRLQAAPGS
jgi:putative molybdopterin biosynthesis protein